VSCLYANAERRGRVALLAVRAEVGGTMCIFVVVCIFCLFEVDPLLSRFALHNTYLHTRTTHFHTLTHPRTLQAEYEEIVASSQQKTRHVVDTLEARIKHHTRTCMYTHLHTYYLTHPFTLQAEYEEIVASSQQKTRHIVDTLEARIKQLELSNPTVRSQLDSVKASLDGG
jgi:hypothetical protein